MVVKHEGKAAEIAAEQEYLDEAMRAHIEGREKNSAARVSARGTAADMRAMRKSLKPSSALGPDDPAAIGWIDTDKGRRVYIGKEMIRSDERGLLVASWKSPVAKTFYSARVDEPGGVTHKRTLRTKRNTVKDFTDLIFAELAEEIEALDRGEITVSDELLESLEANRSETMGDIVRTIQASQYEVIAHPADSLLVIQGGPGTGKTAVALHRVSWLLFNQDELKPDDVLVLGPNPTLTRYIRQVVPSLGDEGVIHLSLDELYRDLLTPRAEEKLQVAKVKGDPRMRHVLAEGLRLRIRTGGLALKFLRSRSNASVVVPAANVAKLIKPLSYLPYNEGRARFIEELQTECVRRLGQRTRVSFDEVFDSASFAQQVDRVWPSLSAQQFLRELLGSRNRMRDAGSNEMTADELRILYRPAARLIRDEPWTRADGFLAHEVQWLMDPRSMESFKHIVVDEAQDLSGMELRAIRRRSRAGAMTLVGDIAQSTGAFARDSWEPVIEALRTEGVPASRETLKHVYRVPTEIFAVANALQSEIAPHLDSPESVRSSGRPPRALSASSESIEHAVVGCAREHLADGLMVGIIATEPRFVQIAGALDHAGVKYSMPDDGALGQSINLVRPEDAKGLEFDAVIVADPAAIHRMDSGARLLYIALTRTTSRMDLVLPHGRVPEALVGVLPEIVEVDAPVSAVEPEADSELRSELVAAGRVGEPADADLSADRGTDPAAVSAHMLPSSAAAVEIAVDAPLASGLAGSVPDPFSGMAPGVDPIIEANADLMLAQLLRYITPTMAVPVVMRMLEKLQQDQQ